MADLNITTIITLITALISILAFNKAEIGYRLRHWPYRETKYNEYYRLLTCGVIHGGWLHLLINLFVFWQFGSIVEFFFANFFGNLYGRTLYLIVYILIIILANIPSLLKHKDNPHYMSIGASGGVSGIVFIYVLFLPWEKLYLYGIIGIPGIIAALLFIAYSHYASRHGRDNIDHSAHMWGAIAGVVLMLLLRPVTAVEFWNNLLAG